jgi:uncharacterized protein
MPANLTPDFLNAEKAFKAAKTDEERLDCLQNMLATIPKHKGTDKMQADIKRKISKIKEKMEQHAKAKKGISYHVKTEGAGQIAVVGVPNAGKSQLVSRLTNTHLEIAPYPFTTREPFPAMMPYLDIRVQLVDLPPVSSEHTDFWVYEVIKAADAVLAVIDITAADPVGQFNEVKNLLEEKKILIEYSGNFEEMPRGAKLLKSLIAATHSEEDAGGDLAMLFKELSRTTLNVIPVAANEDSGIETLRKNVYDLLDVIRIYSKPPGKPIDEGEPYTVPKGSTLIQFAEHVHKDFVMKLRFARCWGSARFDGQTIPHEHILQDGDVIELHI